MNTKTLNRIRLFLGATKSVFRSKFFDHRPFFISHLITTRCFAKCATCLWRGESVEEQDTAKVIDFYRQAKELGFVSTTFWGGEPLLRDDIFDILKACQKFDFVTGLITNGYLLPKYYNRLAQYLDFLIISIDIPNEEHDRLRGVPGMFQNILKGLKQIRTENPRLKIFLNSVISRLNYSYVEQLIPFAECLSTSITFESVNQGLVEFPSKEGRHEVDLRLPLSEEQRAFNLIQELKKNHPIINNSKSYLRLFQQGRVKYRCHAPKISIRVEPNGNITNCQNRNHPLGNVFQKKLEDILTSPQFRWLQKKAESCSSCVDSGVIESSFFWDLNLEVLMNTIKMFIN